MVDEPGKGKGSTVANVLPMATKVEIANLLGEGNSVRAVERVTGVAKSTILRFVVELGEGCERLHNRIVRGVKATDIECDEQWSFIAKKEKRRKAGDPGEFGDVFTFIGFDRASKLVISYAVGKRDQASTNAFINDLRARVLLAPQMSTDGLGVYQPAIAAAFGGCVQYGQIIKKYGYSKSPDHKYEPARDAHFIKKVSIFGAPDPELMSTSGVERFNLTNRHVVGRMRRLCLAFSKTLRGHRAATAFGVAVYNFTRVHSTLRVSAAVEAGLVDSVWDMEQLVTAALSEPVTEPPVRQRLVMPESAGPSRELASGKGFLVLVKGGRAAPSAPTTTPTPAAPVAPMPVVASPAPVTVAATVETPPAAPAALPSPQLDLLSWRPQPRVAFSPTGQARFPFAAEWTEPPTKDGPAKGT